MTLKERYQLIKAAFNGTTPPPAPAPAPTPAPAPAAPTAKTYKLQDGTEISISQAGELPAAGDMVTINGAPAPANTYTLADGATITCDATGMVTAYTAAPAAPAPAPTPAPAPPQPVTLSAMTPEQMTAMYAKFGGSVEEQMGALIIMVKALMEDRFGWKIREGQENAAIEVYKDTIASTPTVSIEEFSALSTKAEKFDQQVATITRHEETIKQLLELTEQLVELPTADPATLTSGKKEKFDRQNDKEDRIKKMAEAVKGMKEEAKNS